MQLNSILSKTFIIQLLCGSTVLQMCQYPHGLWHLKESMQALSQSLEDSLNKTGAKLIYGQEVKSITFDERAECWKILSKSKKCSYEFYATDLVYTPPTIFTRTFKRTS